MAEAIEAEVVAPPEPPKPSKAAQVASALQRAEGAQLAVHGGAAVPTNLDEQLKMAKWAVESGLLPPAIDSAAKAWMIMQRGGELGFPGMTAFEFLYVVNGRVRLTPAGAKAKALGSGLLVDFKEWVEGDGDARQGVVTIKRKGIPTPIVARFSIADAKTARLWGRGAWLTYPDRMLLARPRGFAFSDAFADIIGGLQVREVADLDPGEVIGDAPPAGPPEPRQPPPGGFSLLKKVMGPDASSQPKEEQAPAVADGAVEGAASFPAPPAETTDAEPLLAGVASSQGDSTREGAAQPEGAPEAPPSSRGCDHAPAVEYRKEHPGTKPIVCNGCSLLVMVTAKGPVVVEEPPPPTAPKAKKKGEPEQGSLPR